MSLQATIVIYNGGMQHDFLDLFLEDKHAVLIVNCAWDCAWGCLWGCLWNRGRWFDTTQQSSGGMTVAPPRLFDAGILREEVPSFDKKNAKGRIVALPRIQRILIYREYPMFQKERPAALLSLSAAA